MTTKPVRITRNIEAQIRSLPLSLLRAMLAMQLRQLPGVSPEAQTQRDQIAAICRNELSRRAAAGG